MNNIPYTVEFNPERLTIWLPGKTKKKNSLAVLFKTMTDKHHVIHYSLGDTTGGRKFTSGTSGDYYAEVGHYFDKIDALAECGDENGLPQAMIQALHAEFSRTCRLWKSILSDWDRGWKKKARDKYGYYNGSLQEKDVENLRKALNHEEKLVALLAPNVIGTFDQGYNWIK